jgi:hypothetical protein
VTYFKENNFHLSEGSFSNFSTQKPKRDRNKTQKDKMPFLKQSYTAFANAKLGGVGQLSNIFVKITGH